jgi:hypothetical protein
MPRGLLRQLAWGRGARGGLLVAVLYLAGCCLVMHDDNRTGCDVVVVVVIVVVWSSDGRANWDAGWTCWIWKRRPPVPGHHNFELQHRWETAIALRILCRNTSDGQSKLRIAQPPGCVRLPGYSHEPAFIAAVCSPQNPVLAAPDRTRSLASITDVPPHGRLCNRLGPGTAPRCLFADSVSAETRLTRAELAEEGHGAPNTRHLAQDQPYKPCSPTWNLEASGRTHLPIPRRLLQPPLVTAEAGGGQQHWHCIYEWPP